MLFKRVLGFVRFGCPNRLVHREVVKKLREKKSAKNLALEYFDFFYANTYETEWNSVRLAMLTGQKYVALVNNYSLESDRIRSELERAAAFDMLDYLCLYNAKKAVEADSSQVVDQLEGLKLPPKSLGVYCFDTGETRNFDQPKCLPETGLLSKNESFNNIKLRLNTCLF
jgi:hypothetical protein